MLTTDLRPSRPEKPNGIRVKNTVRSLPSRVLPMTWKQSKGSSSTAHGPTQRSHMTSRGSIDWESRRYSAPSSHVYEVEGPGSQAWRVTRAMIHDVLRDHAILDHSMEGRRDRATARRAGVRRVAALHRLLAARYCRTNPPRTL